MDGTTNVNLTIAETNQKCSAKPRCLSWLCWCWRQPTDYACSGHSRSLLPGRRCEIERKVFRIHCDDGRWHVQFARADDLLVYGRSWFRRNSERGCTGVFVVLGALPAHSRHAWKHHAAELGTSSFRPNLMMIRFPMFSIHVVMPMIKKERLTGSLDLFCIEGYWPKQGSPTEKCIDESWTFFSCCRDG